MSNTLNIEHLHPEAVEYDHFMQKESVQFKGLDAVHVFINARGVIEREYHNGFSYSQWILNAYRQFKRPNEFLVSFYVRMARVTRPA